MPAPNNKQKAAERQHGVVGTVYGAPRDWKSAERVCLQESFLASRAKLRSTRRPLPVAVERQLCDVTQLRPNGIRQGLRPLLCGLVGQKQLFKGDAEIDIHVGQFDQLDDHHAKWVSKASACFRSRFL